MRMSDFYLLIPLIFFSKVTNGCLRTPPNGNEAIIIPMEPTPSPGAGCGPCNAVELSTFDDPTAMCENPSIGTCANGIRTIQCSGANCVVFIDSNGDGVKTMSRMSEDITCDGASGTFSPPAGYTFTNAMIFGCSTP